MKSKLSVRTASRPPFPCLYRSRLGEQVVLFTGLKEGVIVHSPDPRNVGFWGRSFQLEDWEPLRPGEQVVLEND